MVFSSLGETQQHYLSNDHVNQSLQSTAHITDTGHEEGTPLVEEVVLPDEELFFPDGATSQTSLLLTELGNAEYFTYQNETKVQNLVAACLKDALRSLGLYNDFAVENEYSLFFPATGHRRCESQRERNHLGC